MADTVDELQIKINAEATKANDAIDRLVGKLDRLTTSLSRVNGTNLNGLANGVQRLGNAMQVMNTIKTADFTRLATNLTKLGSVNVSALNSAASSMSHLTRAFNSLGTVSANAQAVGEMAKNIAKLGNKSVQTAITNIPQLATAMNNLMVTLSRSPQVSQNVIQMTNALANLASQGSRVGTASNSMVRGLNRTSSSANTARKSFGGLASAIGKFYATYFMVIRGLKGLWSSIESTADYTEAFNYYIVSFGKIASKWDSEWENYADENARNYANSFVKTMNETFKKLSGVSFDPQTGLISETGLKNLGLNLQEVTQYAAQLASMMDAVGQSGETTLATTNAFVKLAGDISSLYNIDYSEAANKLRSVLQGQSRAGYGFGWDTTMASLQATADKLNLSKAVNEMSQMEKQQLRILTILQQSRVAWGDQSNTINTLANQIRIFKNNIKEAAMTLGQLFVPILAKIMPIINGITIAIKNLMTSIAGFFGIKIEDIGQGYSDIGDDIGDISDSLDDVAKSAKKANAGLRAFDELKTINMPDASGSGTGGLGGIDLTDKILQATEEYEKAWQEAFDKMESKAQEFANKFEKIFEPIKSIFKDISVGDYFNLGKDTSKLVENIYNFFTNAMNDVDWIGIGSKIGEFLRGIDFLAVFESIKETVVTALESALKLWFGSLKEAPLETALITAVSLWKFTKFGQEIGKKIWAAIPEKYTKNIGIKIASIALTWEVGFDIGKWIGEKLFPENATYYENFKWFGEGGFFDAVFPPEDDMQEHIRTWILGWGVIGDYISEWWNESVTPWFTKDKWIELFNNSFDAAKEEWSLVSEWWSTSTLGQWWEKDVKPWFTKKKWKDEFNKAMEGIKSEWSNFNLWHGGKLLTWWNKVKSYFTTDKWTFSGIKDGLKTAWEGAVEKVKEVWNMFADWLNQRLTFKLEPIVVMGKTLYSGGTITLGSIPTYATGGFPEDGLFMANHNELVGQFSNGKTAVANNEQITDGIKQGVREAVAEILVPYLSDIAQSSRETANKEFGITQNEVGKAARNYARDYTTRTGRPAYSF